MTIGVFVLFVRLFRNVTIAHLVDCGVRTGEILLRTPLIAFTEENQQRQTDDLRRRLFYLKMR